MLHLANQLVLPDAQLHHQQQHQLQNSVSHAASPTFYSHHHPGGFNGVSMGSVPSSAAAAAICTDAAVDGYSYSTATYNPYRYSPTPSLSVAASLLPNLGRFGVCENEHQMQNQMKEPLFEPESSTQDSLFEPQNPVKPSFFDHPNNSVKGSIFGSQSSAEDFVYQCEGSVKDSLFKSPISINDPLFDSQNSVKDSLFQSSDTPQQSTHDNNFLAPPILLNNPCGDNFEKSSLNHLNMSNNNSQGNDQDSGSLVINKPDTPRRSRLAARFNLPSTP